jgi:hypothetical protein
MANARSDDFGENEVFQPAEFGRGVRCADLPQSDEEERVVLARGGACQAFGSVALSVQPVQRSR